MKLGEAMYKAGAAEGAGAHRPPTTPRSQPTDRCRWMLDFQEVDDDKKGAGLTNKAPVR